MGSNPIRTSFVLTFFSGSNVVRPIANSLRWHYVRVVKELDLNSNGLCPHRFEPCWCRFFSCVGNESPFENRFIVCSVTLRWSSGYDVRLTRGRSPVQARDEV